MKLKKLTAIVIAETYSFDIIDGFIDKHPNLSIAGNCTDFDKALRLFSKTRPDIVFFNIFLNGANPFDLIKKFFERKPRPYIVIISENENHLMPALKAGVFDYLLKPLTEEELGQTINNIEKHYSQSNIENRISLLEQKILGQQKISFTARSGRLFINPNDIYYIEADCNYSDIYFSKNRREVISMNIGAIEQLLPPEFIRINRSIIINANWLTRISSCNRECILEKDSEKVQFSVPEKRVSHLRRIL